ncbi:MAG: PAS domain S-box protein, partial [Desulfobulbaceae bacterium]|nr:PAS domain S-box protein [Desulfobulbaceae bacterium]
MRPTSNLPMNKGEQVASAFCQQNRFPCQNLLDIHGKLIQRFNSDYPHNLNLVLKTTLDMVPGAFVLYNRFDFDRQEIITHHGWQCPEGFRKKGRLSGRICYEELIRAGRPFAVFNDLRESIYSQSDPDIKKHFLRAYIGYPVIYDGDIVGSLEVFNREPIRYDAAHANIMEMMVGLVSFIEERQQVEKDLKNKLAHEKLLADITTNAISGMDAENFQIYFLKTIGRSLGVEAAAIFWHDKRTHRFSKLAHWYADIIPEPSDCCDINQLLDLKTVSETINNNTIFSCADARLLSNNRVRQVMHQLGLKSILLIPLCNQMEVYGVCAWQLMQAPHRWRGEDISFLKTVAQILTQKLVSCSIENRLDESEALNHQMLQLSAVAIYRVDLVRQRFVKVNDHMCRATGYSEEELLAMQPMDLLTPSSRVLFRKRCLAMAASKPVTSDVEFEIKTKSGTLEWCQFHIRHLYENGKITGANVVAHFVTEQKKNEAELANYRKELESLVEARTSELANANEQLREEIRNRVQTAEKLRASSDSLKEMNTAMRVLLDKRMEDHQRAEEHIRLNLKELIDPYLTRLENSGLQSNQDQLLEVIRMNLEEVVASSLPEISSKYYIFSPNELQVVNLIRKGKTTKEMARLLNLSTRTVETYRNSIRQKLNLKN